MTSPASTLLTTRRKFTLSLLVWHVRVTVVLQVSYYRSDLCVFRLGYFSCRVHATGFKRWLKRLACCCVNSYATKGFAVRFFPAAVYRSSGCVHVGLLFTNEVRVHVYVPFYLLKFYYLFFDPVSSEFNLYFFFSPLRSSDRPGCNHLV